MKRLATKNINTDKEYERIYFDRQIKGLDDVDLRRWRVLLKKYKGGRLLDMGCLDSLVPMMAKGMYPRAEIWGMDQATEAVNQMQERFPTILYHVGDVYKSKFHLGYFNYVVAGELIEHLEEPDKFIKEAMRILKRGGTLAISTPLEEAKEVGAVDKDRHLWSYSVEDLREMLEPYGKVDFEILRSIHKPYKYVWPQLICWVTKGK